MKFTSRPTQLFKARVSYQLATDWTMPAQIPTSSAPAEVYSPSLLGLMISFPLAGVALAQAVYYFRSYPKDRCSLKILIGVLMSLEAIYTFCFANFIWIWYIRIEMGLTDILPKVFWVTMFLAYTTISLVQSAYAVRVWHISGKNKSITGTLLFFSFLQFVGGIGTTINMTVIGTPRSVYTIPSMVLGGIELGSSVMCDVMISISLVYFLRSNRGGFRRTKNVIDSLIIYSVNVGLVTSILALANLVTWLAIQSSFDYSVFHFILTRFYVNSLLATLNSRAKLRRELYAAPTSQMINEVLLSELPT